MAKDVIIIGAGGHAKVVADIVLRSGDNLVGFLDDDNEKQGKAVYKGYGVIGTISDAVKHNDKYFFVAIGDNSKRAEIVNEYSELMWYTAIHPNAVVADTVKIGEGTVVMAGAVVNPDSIIGCHSIINTTCSIDHDNKVGNFVHVSPGAHLAGTVSVGNFSWICAGAIVSNNVEIIGDSIVGAGAVVLNNIEEPGVYVGVPARNR